MARPRHVRARLHRVALRVFARLPAWARRRVVRTMSPSFTVGAMCVIERPDGAILFVRQSYRSRWGVPGGLLKRGEDAVDGAVREVREEVGLDVELLAEPAVVVDPNPQRVDIIFRARVSDAAGDAVEPRSPEILEARWFPRDQLPELQPETVTAIIALARATPPDALPLPQPRRWWVA